MTDRSAATTNSDTSAGRWRVPWLAFAGALLGVLAARFVHVGPTAVGAGCTPYERAQVVSDIESVLTAEQVACLVAERAFPASQVAVDCAISVPFARMLQGGVVAAAAADPGRDAAPRD